MHLQPVKLLAVQSGEGLEKVGKAANIYGAPLAIIVCADHQRRAASRIRSSFSGSTFRSS